MDLGPPYERENGTGMEPGNCFFPLKVHESNEDLDMPSKMLR